MPFQLQNLPLLVTRRLVIKPLTSPRENDAARAIRQAVAAADTGTCDPDCMADPLRFDRRNTRMDGGKMFYAFLRGDKSKAVVMLGVNTDKDGRIRVSYQTHPDYRRQGFASEAQRALIAVLARAYPDKSFAANVFADNKASRRIMAHSGFTFTGIHHLRYRMKTPDIRCPAYTRPSLNAAKAANLKPR